MKRFEASRDLLTAVLLGVAALFVYSACQAPTVLWGDDAELQRAAWLGDLLAPPRGHFLWLWIARAFDGVAIGDPAFRTNELSAIFAAAGTTAAALCVRACGGRPSGMVAAALALGLSHTYWLHAERTEVYALHCLLFLLALLAFLEWLRSNPPRPALLFCAFALCGVGLTNHMLMALALPTFGIAVLTRFDGKQDLRVAMLGFAVGLLPLAFIPILAGGGAPAVAPWEVLSATHVNVRSLATTGAYYVFQFPLSFPLALAGGVALWKSARAATWVLIGQIVTVVSVVTCMDVKDTFVFHLPAYACCAILIGVGFTTCTERGRLARISACLALAATPFLYFGLAISSDRGWVEVIKVRNVPGRTAGFFLWPPKNDYMAASNFAKGALDSVEDRAVILADWTLAQPLLYLQQVEGIRRDVSVVIAPASKNFQLPFLVERSRRRPVYVAALDEYYDRSEIEQRFQIVASGPIYRLLPRY